MASNKPVALITGCSSGGLGAALAKSLKKAGYLVVATARNTAKLTETDDAGIEHLQLDVTSSNSITQCVKSLEALTGRLDLLINNAGAGYPMPVVDIDLDEARKIYELNTFSIISVTRAFLPMLMKSENAKVVNHISMGAYLSLPFMSLYTSSKAAANSITDILRLELKPFGIKVIALMSGSVKSNLSSNLTPNKLPEDSIYRVVTGGLSMMKDPEGMVSKSGPGMDAYAWADQVVGDLNKANPPHQIWRGSSVNAARIGCHLPTGFLDRAFISTTKLHEVDEALKNANAT